MESDRAEGNRRIVARNAVVRSLIETFSDRIKSDDVTSLRGYMFVGEAGLALDNLLDVLIKSQVAVAEDELRALGDAIANSGGPQRDFFHLVPETLRLLNAVR